MTKIQIDDGKKPAEKPVESVKSAKSAKKAPKKIIVTEAVSVHSSVQKSTTLSRKYVKKPTTIAVKTAPTEAPKPATAKKITVISKLTKKRAEIEREQAARAKKLAEEKAERAAKLAREKAERTAKIAQEKAARAAKIAEEKAARAARLHAEKLAKKQAEEAKKMSAQQRRTEARLAKKACKKAEKASKSDRALKSASAVLTNIQKKEAAAKPVAPKMEYQFRKKSKAGRIFLALICSGATVAALVAFVHFSIPDLSVRVAAIQTGIDAAYPSFVPRGYSLTNVTSDKEGVVIMTFTGPDNVYFTLSEEKSTWDSTALLNNYVKKNFPSDFVTLREQGITIYVRGEKAAWVNGGLLYKIDATGKYLTKEQIRNIATSL